jgi:hypothetical protein
MYVGDTTFMDSIWRITGHSRLIVEVHVMPAIVPTEGLTRQEVVRRARAAIGDRLGLVIDDSVPEQLVRVRAA